eukprot:scaffold502_cov271-Prasinococcus_capsulatus_cf.AAC.2
MRRTAVGGAAGAARQRSLGAGPPPGRRGRCSRLYARCAAVARTARTVLLSGTAASLKRQLGCDALAGAVFFNGGIVQGDQDKSIPQGA